LVLMPVTDQIDLWAKSPAANAVTPIARPIHYLGSKLRLVDRISVLLDELDPSRGWACDLFTGSGTVAATLAQTRPVVAVDIQEYSRVLCSALLAAERPTATQQEELARAVETSAFSQELRWAIDPLATLEEHATADALVGRPDTLFDLVEHGCVLAVQLNACEAVRPCVRGALEETARRLIAIGGDSSVATTMTRYYGGSYFSFAQAAMLDSILNAVYSLPDSMRDIGLAAALSTASDVVNTVGKQFAQPIRPRKRTGEPKPHLIRKIARDRSLDLLNSFTSWLARYAAHPAPKHEHHVVRADYREFLKNSSVPVSALYADPPYTRDHYSRYYHVLETMCLRDAPEVSRTNLSGTRFLSRGLYRRDRHQSPFCIHRQAPAAFDELFCGARRHHAPLVLSYSPYEEGSGSRPRLLSVRSITDIGARYYSSVDVISPGRLTHSKLNHSDVNVDATEEAEVFIICRP
jgi:adenine-specific DNA methylase